MGGAAGEMGVQGPCSGRARGLHGAGGVEEELRASVGRLKPRFISNLWHKARFLVDFTQTKVALISPT